MNEYGGYYFEAGEITTLIIFGGKRFKMANGHFKENWLTLLIPGTILSAITVPEKQRWRIQEEVCVDVRRMDTQVMLTLCHHRVYIHPDVTHHNNVMTKTLTTIEDRMEVGIGTYEGEAFLRIERMNSCVMKK